MSPEGMLKGSMIAIPKGRWTNLTTSDNFAAITHGNIFVKPIDMIVMNKEHLCTSDTPIQF